MCVFSRRNRPFQFLLNVPQLTQCPGQPQRMENVMNNSVQKCLYKLCNGVQMKAMTTFNAIEIKLTYLKPLTDLNAPICGITLLVASE